MSMYDLKVLVGRDTAGICSAASRLCRRLLVRSTQQPGAVSSVPVFNDLSPQWKQRV